MSDSCSFARLCVGNAKLARPSSVRCTNKTAPSYGGAFRCASMALFSSRTAASAAGLPESRPHRRAQLAQVPDRGIHVLGIEQRRRLFDRDHRRFLAAIVEHFDAHRASHDALPRHSSPLQRAGIIDGRRAVKSETRRPDEFRSRSARRGLADRRRRHGRFGRASVGARRSAAPCAHVPDARTRVGGARRRPISASTGAAGRRMSGRRPAAVPLSGSRALCDHRQEDTSNPPGSARNAEPTRIAPDSDSTRARFELGLSPSRTADRSRPNPILWPPQSARRMVRAAGASPSQARRIARSRPIPSRSLADPPQSPSSRAAAAFRPRPRGPPNRGTAADSPRRTPRISGRPRRARDLPHNQAQPILLDSAKFPLPTD